MIGANQMLSIIPNWKKVLKDAPSIKFVVLSGICSVGEIMISYYPDKLPRGAMAGLSGLFALGGLIARFLMKTPKDD